MSAPAAGRRLLAAGGLLLVLGSFWPEAVVTCSNALHPGAPRPRPGRSHWAVIVENVDVLAHPDPFVETPAWNRLDYATQTAGLGYLALAGVVLAASAWFAGSRPAAVACYGVHAAALLGLGCAALVLRMTAPAGAGDSTKELRLLLLAAAAFFLLFAGETLLAVRALRRRRSGDGRGLDVVDSANLLPALLLAALNAILYVVLRRHPNWPAAGYLVGAIGAALVLVGMALRRAR